jgi:glutathione synthase/RimK-type ligase-like ATP-grasp enzyme
MDKRYLRELEQGGLPVIPTIWAEPPAAGRPGGGAAEMRRDWANELEGEAVARGWGRAVVKPAVDLGAMRLKRVPATAIAASLAELDEPSLVQPFLPSLEQEGELSIIFFAGEAAHTVRKRPADGDFRVQENYGGRFAPVDPPPEGLELARAVLATLDEAPLYGRVDMVRDADDRLCVIELELIEPSFYLHHADEAVAGWFADLCLERAG